MKNHALVGMLAAFMLLAAGGIATAQATGQGFGDVELLKGKVGEVIGFVLAVVMGIFFIVGCGMIIQSLCDSKKYGFGHFAIALVVVLVAGFALFTITGLAGQDGQKALESINGKE